MIFQCFIYSISIYQYYSVYIALKTQINEDSANVIKLRILVSPLDAIVSELSTAWNLIARSRSQNKFKSIKQRQRMGYLPRRRPIKPKRISLNLIKDRVVLWRSLARFFRNIVDTAASLRPCKIIQRPFSVRGTCARIIEEALCKLSSKTITDRLRNDDTLEGGGNFPSKHHASTYKRVYVTAFNFPPLPGSWSVFFLSIGLEFPS